ncbi:poly(beta-D-mannuronate) lyase [Lewinella marina]|uniref:Alginate lyase n=1 Tax=Neolewinella marina TaxID=438751 RepID=A0A2G0CBK8_9BACT|nr:polysaccharide lyase 6 family protein [Neolewinella marina]NJB87100.1 poly(beta-D-mannuronate) lyase [Neolewinella marina]PHK97369.1 alginate lyase [Neolewinella marina]
MPLHYLPTLAPAPRWLSRCLVLLLLYGCGAPAEAQEATDALVRAIRDAQPGATIVVPNGSYQDLALEFTGRGTAEAPIRLVAEEKGKVFLEGQSYLRLSGEHLVVEGLVFRNGYTPTSEVISFRTADDELCNYCRVTECVIDNYNPPERYESDYWVGLYGRNNRFDHNYLTGKRNQGVTLAVRLNSEESRENGHRIDHNYFGERPILGSNGGETLRIGTSHYSLTNSNTVVESNYFDRCNGEHEIISNKSGGNIFRGNTFHECQGTLTMRHGNNTTVDGNFFFGNGKPNTGGIRIINERQTVTNNYLAGLTGYRFRGALVIMNGVPNSPINRYHQVKDSEASNNVFVDCDHIQLGAGSDEERSAVPESTVVADNVFVNRNRDSLFTVYDDISGITFRNNLLDKNLVPLQDEGFERRPLKLTDAGHGVMLPAGTPAADSIRARIPTMATPENTGVNWYPRREEAQHFGTGQTIEIGPGENTLSEAVARSAAGDIIRLAPGEYLQTMTIDLRHPITIEAAGSEKPLLVFRKTSLLNIENGGALTLRGVHVDGRECLDQPLNSVIRTSRYSMVNNYKLFIEDCDFTNLDVNHSFNVLRVYKHTFADSIVVRNSSFRNVSGSVLPLDQENDDIGIYNAENVVLENCFFDKIGQAALHLHRGGSDESTFGPMLTIDRCTFDEVGTDEKWNRSESSVSLHGTQYVHITNSVFDDSAPVRLHLVVGEPVVLIENSVFSGGTELLDNGEPYRTQNLHLNLEEPVTTLPDGTPVGTQLSE